jgi:hypothetical protein|tara:strand:- start:2981 stop:4189 length:1209 start_codon:yes stop_codon:yes gene_type:complete
MIALYPGAYKPPHSGHFEIASSLLKGMQGRVYNVDNYKDAGPSTLSKDSDTSVKVDKVVVFIGAGERNGITQAQSEAIWKIYQKYIPNLEIVTSVKNPMIEARDYAAANPNEEFYAITGIRGEEDFVDLRRISTFKKTPNVKGLAVTSKDNSEVRATNFRKAILSGNLDLIRDFFPKEVSSEEILKILNMLKSTIVSEQMKQKLEEVMTDIFVSEKEVVEEAAAGTAIAPRSILKSKDRAHLITLYKRVKDQIGSNNVDVKFMQDHIRITVQDEYVNNKFDFTPFMGSILEYMLDQKMSITPLPEIKMKKDLGEAASVFGRTAYYNPELKEIVLYTEGRHPKDVLRSFTHEMVHHIQNMEGRLKSYGTTNTNEDESLVEIEKEAYMVGNITFRNWEDKVKNK